uniref:Phenylalanyl-tRNA synthetase n=1 Tax=Panagrolaimus sp. JU765 TaxID=591449 RepID=A0AC34Q044_9BILA
MLKRTICSVPFREFTFKLFFFEETFSKKSTYFFSTCAEQTVVVPKPFVPTVFELDGKRYNPDSLFNISPAVMRLFSRRLLQEPGNPLNLLKQRIVNHMHQQHRKKGNRSPIFTVCENQSRVVSVFENFDSLLTPLDHVSRRPSDTYYVNKDYCLRAHTSAHQYSLIKQGFDAFLVFGDVYRRDEIDRTHFPCFHQVEGVRLYSAEDLFGIQPTGRELQLFDSSERNKVKQAGHSEDTAKVLELRLKSILEELSRALFGQNVQMRWVDAYFPFTHPSFELEVFYNDTWLEVLGCGLMEQKLLENAGAGDKVGWAFGLGLERLAMVLYSIPDIRLFWSKDTGFLNQFKNLKPEETIKYQPISIHPQLYMDLSFWLPNGVTPTEMKANGMDLIRSTGGDLVEQVEIVDEFFHPKKKLTSQCYRIVYRSNERPLKKEEINEIHQQIANGFVEQFGVKIR